MPVLLLILACALWGLSFPLVKALHLEQSARMPEASSVFLAAWMQAARFGMGAAVLLPFLLKQARPSALEIRQGLALAFWGGVGMWLQADGLAYTEASTSAFLTQAYCILLPLWACFRLKRWPGTRVILATLMVLIGGAILSGVRPENLKLGRGELETLGCALLFTFQILKLEDARHVENRGSMVTFIMFLGIAVLFVPISLATAPHPSACLTAGASFPAWAMIAGLALPCSVGAYLLMNIWQPRVTSTEAGLIYTIEPVFTAVYVLFLPVMLGRLVGASYPNETLTTQLLAGGALIVGANVLMQWKRPPHGPTVGSVNG
ncbi:MAG: DMT family transporter [Verrucomicrobiota bacterium]